MNTEEALHLLALVSDMYGEDAGYIHQLANGDHVVRLCRDNEEDWFLWSTADYEALRNAEIEAAQRFMDEIGRDTSKRRKRKGKQLQEVSV